ncbi:hypothetical protein F4677DRAFT_99782 [Hypoxylon crocopeplum]|nr:hypothetical protein F4677DRAFT_99782 [Hypoxylon crocopeplum]
MQQTQEQKQTPSRRRQGGRHRNTPQQKTYASENDVPQHKHGRVESPSTPAVGNTQSLRPSSTNQKGRNKDANKKPRNIKNGSASLPFKDSPVPIFAGSTFHASPAPSALPIPSFLSKPEADSPAMTKTSSPEEALSSASTPSDEPTSPSPPSIPGSKDSPLEFFFRADRAEKARTRRTSSVHTNATPIGPFSPPHESPKELSASSKVTAVPTETRRPHYPKRATVQGISADELDGNPSQPIGPAFSTPYQERMRAVRSARNSAQATPTPTVLRSQDPNSSEALKRYLFTGLFGEDKEQSHQISTPSKQTAHPTFERQSQQAHQRSKQHELSRAQPPQQRLPRGVFPASVLTANAQSGQAPASPVDAQLINYRTEHVVAMEDGLRRMLKLGP